LPKKTLNTIVSTGNDYVVQVKKNQKNLYLACEKISQENAQLSSFESYDKAHGREELRRVTLFNRDNNISKEWESAKLVIKVERLSERNKKTQYEISYYISSLIPDSATQIAHGIRNHWSIENRLHWVKDVIQNEDNAKIKKGNGIETLSILKNIAINICRQNGYDSIKYAAIHFASNVKELIKLVRT
jgi:predicted transposase YbfD/YdcC